MNASADPLSGPHYKPVLIVLHGETSEPGRIGPCCANWARRSTSGARASAIPCRKPWRTMPARSSSAAR